MSDERPDQRRYRRFPLDARARIIGSEGTWEADLVDISIKGLLLTRPADWPEDRVGRFEIELKTDMGWPLHMTVDLAWISDERIGGRCHRIDMDSFTRLKRLVELNIGDPDLLHRELEALR